MGLFALAWICLVGHYVVLVGSFVVCWVDLIALDLCVTGWFAFALCVLV